MKTIAISMAILASSLAAASVSSVKFQGQKLSPKDVAIYQEFQLKAGDFEVSLSP